MQMLAPTFLILLLFTSFCDDVLSCNQLDHDTLLSFYNHISIPSPLLNWSKSTNCCQWEGIACTTHHGIARATRLWLPEKHLSGTITPIFANMLPFLTHLNLSHNQLSGPLPVPLFHSLTHLQTLDLSSNHFNGSIHPSFLNQAFNLITFNISNNTFTNSIPSSICKVSKLLQILDFSMNQFTGSLSPGLGICPNLQVFRAGANSLSGSLPHDLYNVITLKEISLHDNQFSGPIHNTIVMLSNLNILDLHLNQLSGELPPNIGFLSNLEMLSLHTNRLNGTLPPSLMNCSKLKTLLLRDNLFIGEISSLDFSKLLRLQLIDLGSNNLTGKIPETLCSCSSLTAVRFSHNQLVGEIPACMASLKSLQHLAVANNNFSNVVGALKNLKHCDNLSVLILYACFHDEMMPDDDDMKPQGGFQRLQILTLGECHLKGQIPSWIANLSKLKLLDLSKNYISGPIPSWLGTMPSLFILNLTQNTISGHIPPRLCRMPALISDNNATSNLIYLALPLLIDGRRYNRLLNMRRVLAVGGNSLSGGIPEEIGRLKLVQVLDLSNNNFSGSIPAQLSNLTNLETLNISDNHLFGKIPESLRELHFLSAFSVADNNLEGEIPRGGQFDTFSADSFEGNPKLCGDVVNKRCKEVDKAPWIEEEGDDDGITWYKLPFGLGFSVGLFAVSIIFVARELVEQGFRFPITLPFYILYFTII